MLLLLAALWGCREVMLVQVLLLECGEGSKVSIDVYVFVEVAEEVAITLCGGCWGEGEVG